MDMRTLIAAGMTGTLMLGGIGAAVADSHDVVEVPDEIVEVPDEVVEVPEVPEDVEVPDEVVEVPEVPEVPEDVEVPDEVVEVPEVPEDVEVPDEVVEVPEDVEVPEVPEDEAGSHPDNFGARVSADARGESDGVRGVDGRQISAEAKAKRTAS